MEGGLQLGVPLSPHTVARLVLYLQELVRWNAKVNLSGLTEEADIITKHFLDSLAAFKVLKVGPGLIRPGPGLRVLDREVSAPTRETPRLCPHPRRGALDPAGSALDQPLGP